MIVQQYDAIVVQQRKSLLPFYQSCVIPVTYMGHCVDVLFRGIMRGESKKETSFFDFDNVTHVDDVSQDCLFLDNVMTTEMEMKKHRTFFVISGKKVRRHEKGKGPKFWTDGENVLSNTCVSSCSMSDLCEEKRGGGGLIVSTRAHRMKNVLDVASTFWSESWRIYQGGLALAKKLSLLRGGFTASQELLQWTPDSIGALAIVDAEKGYQMGRALLYDFLDCCEISRNLCGGLFCLGSVESIKEWIDVENPRPFDIHSIGLGWGMRQRVRNFSLWNGVVYMPSDMQWKDNAGKAQTQSLYCLLPSLSCKRRLWHLALLLGFAGHFHHMERYIHVDDQWHQAESNHVDANLLMKLDVSCLCIRARRNMIVPHFSVDWIHVFEPDVQEFFADPWNLAIQKKYSSFLKSVIDIDMTTRIYVEGALFLPTLSFGWANTTQLTSPYYLLSYSRLIQEEGFYVTSYSVHWNQWKIGCRLYLMWRGFWGYFLYDFSIGRRASMHFGYGKIIGCF